MKLCSRRREFLRSSEASLQATGSKLSVADSSITLGICLLDGHWRRTRLQVVAPLLVWVAAVVLVGTLAQQPHGDYNVQGYTCNGRDRRCSTFAFYRTVRMEDSWAIAGYFNASANDVSGLNNLTASDSFSKGQALYIPINCTCTSSVFTSQMEVTLRHWEHQTYMGIVSDIFGFLTTYQAIILWNPLLDANNLTVGDTIKVPIFCACPTTQQIESGVKFLLTYTVASGDTLDDISSFFGVTNDLINSVQEIVTLRENSTLLIPLSEPTLPRIPTGMKTVPHGIRESTSSAKSRSKVVEIVSGLAAGAVAVLLMLGFYIARHRRISSQRQRHSNFTIVDPDRVPRAFTFKEISKATRNFKKSQLLGTGGFGAVYRGRLPSGALVAVKQMKIESKHGRESFRAEVASLSHIRHRNLVELRGWCHDDSRQLYLVYEYMCMGNLDTLLFRTSERIVLELIPLAVRRSILTGVAAALLYLHEECAQCVLHRDIKSSNVLLDGDLNAYLGDFGLVCLVDHQKMGVTTMIAGTFGYMAPEMHITCKATKESDIFSFGVLMLEVMCGARPLDMDSIDQGDIGLLVDKVWQAHEGGDILDAADSRLASSMDQNMKVIRSLLQLGLLCCNPNPTDRPSTRVVSQLLLLQDVEEMEAAMTPLPRCKPQALYNAAGFSQLLLGMTVQSSDAESGIAAPLSGLPIDQPVQNTLTTSLASSAFYSGPAVEMEI